jgi:hypothetical protein
MNSANSADKHAGQLRPRIDFAEILTLTVNVKATAADTISEVVAKP